MAQSGYTPILLYGSNTASSVPSASNLTSSTSGVELALNYTDGKLYYKDNSGVVQLLASKAAAAGVLSFSAGSTGLTPSTATSGAVTLAGTLGISNGGTGITSFGTGVQTALGVNVGTAGSFLVNGGALGTPSSGTVTNLTGTASININGTVGATTPSTGAFTTLSGTGQLTLTNASNYNLYASGAGANFMQGILGVGGTAPLGTLSVTLPTGRAIGNAWDSKSALFGGIGAFTGALGISFDTTNGAILESAAPGVASYPISLLGSINKFLTAGVERGSVSAVGVWSLGAAVGSESLRVTPVASAVNYWNAAGAVTGANPYLQANGSDTNIGFTYTTKGSGSHFFQTNNFASIQFVVAHTASAVNYLQVTGGAAGGGVVISAQGSDANIDLVLASKGTGVLAFGTYTAGIVAQAGYISIKDAAGNTRRLLVG